MYFAQICSVCGQEHEPYYRDTRAFLAKALAAPKYSLCCCCGRAAPNPADAGYKRKYKRYARRLKATIRVEEAFRAYEKEKEEERQADIAREDADDGYELRVGRT